MIIYIAKDKNREIFIYNYKPAKRGTIWACAGGVCQRGYHNFPIEETDLPESVNPQWEDDEPIKVNLKIEKI